MALFCATSDRGLVYRSMVRELAQAHGVKITDELCGNERSYDFRVNALRASSSNPEAVFIGFSSEIA